MIGIAMIEQLKQFRVILVGNVPSDLVVGGEATIRIDAIGTKTESVTQDWGCDVLRIMDTNSTRYVWFRTWVKGVTVKVKFPSNVPSGEGQRTKQVESADPIERAIENQNKLHDAGKGLPARVVSDIDGMINVDEIRVKALEVMNNCNVLFDDEDEEQVKRVSTLAEYKERKDSSKASKDQKS